MLLLALFFHSKEDLIKVLVQMLFKRGRLRFEAHGDPRIVGMGFARIADGLQGCCIS